MWRDSSSHGGENLADLSLGEKDLASGFSTNSESKEGTAEKATSSTSQNVAGLQGNFEQQQAMIGQLRDMLKQKEANKKKSEFEDYATRLAKMKPRLVRGRGRVRGREKDESLQQEGDSTITKPESSIPKMLQTQQQIPSSSGPPKVQEKPVEAAPILLEVVSDVDTKSLPDSVTATTPEPVLSSTSTLQSETGTGSTNRSKILLLRKQLEENRLKFERQQRDNVEKRAVMEDMKERIEKLREEVEQRDTLIQSLQELDSFQHSDPGIKHLYQQIMHKDNTILELSDKVDYLERVVKDQEERLSEKDQVISARTEAVALITQDRDEKIIKTMTELDDIRTAMKEMQENFQKKEAEWKTREDTFDGMIAEKVKKVMILEENCHRIENIRFELSARNAELQEKIVSLQCEAGSFSKEFSKMKTDLQDKSSEIDDLKRKLVRAEAFGQKKLKALEKQIKSTNSGNQILELENQIAELEDEKGNLQLKLVDFDENKTQCEALIETISTCRQKIEQLNSELMSQITSVTQLENEKIHLVEELNAKDFQINSLEESAAQFQAQFEDMKQSKVTLELRLCEIEEERDSAIKRQKDLENEQKKADGSSTVEGSLLQNELQEKIKDMIAKLDEKDLKISHLEQTISEKEKFVKQAEEEKEAKLNENQCLISFLAEKENLITTQAIKIEKHDEVVAQIHEKLSSKDNDIHNLGVQNTNLQLELNRLVITIDENKSTIHELNTKFTELRNELEFTNNSISLLKASEQSLHGVVGEKENAIMVLEEQICHLNDQLERKETMVADHINKIENVDSLLQLREKQMLNLESEIADKLKENSQQVVKCAKYEEELKNLKQIYQELQSKHESECETLSCLLSDKDNHIKTLENEVNIQKSGLKTSEKMVSSFEKEACEKNCLYDVLLVEKSALENSLTRMQTKITDLETNSELKSLDIKMLQDNLQEKDEHIQKLKAESCTDLDKARNLEEKYLGLEKQKEKLDEDNAELMAAIDAKENHYQQLQIEFRALIANMENENGQLFQSLSQKETEINDLKETLDSFKAEATKTATYSEEVKVELGQKLNQISLLENELKMKSEEFDATLSQLETIQQKVSENEQALNASNKELEYYKKQNDEFSQTLEQVAKEKQDQESTLSSLQQTNEEKEKEIIRLQSEVQMKVNIENVQTDLQVAESHLTEMQNIKAYVEQLHEQMNTNAAKHWETNLSYESRIQEEEVKFAQLEKELSSYKAEIAQQRKENATDMSSVEDLNSKLKYFEELSNSQYYNLQEKDVSIQSFIDQIALFKTEKSVCDEEICKLKEAVDGEKLLYANLMSQYESLSKQLSIKDKEISAFRASSEVNVDSIPTSAPELNSETFQAHEEEVKKLKEQLKEAQQAIIHLETSLATQSLAQETPQESSDVWGIVDLGEPSITKASMQTLIEKDKTLTVIQEQLKNALEDVNVANDEKKILQHQMKTLEAELERKDEKVLAMETLIQELEIKIVDLKQSVNYLNSVEPPPVCEENMSTPASSTIVSQVEGSSPVITYFKNENNLLPDTEQESTSSSHPKWFKSPAELESNTFWDNLGEQGNEIESEGAPLEAKDNVPIAEMEDHSDIVTNLKYKLSWYEENWLLWTEHYNQLQANCQTAQQQILALNQELETLKSESESCKKETNIQNPNITDNVQELNMIISKMRVEKNQLAETVQNLRDELNSSVSDLNQAHRQQLEEINHEMTKLKGFETQVFELQAQLQTHQYQCSVLESKVTDAEVNASKVAEYETLYGELQTCMHEVETKREGTNSRVQELELMVQCAESEITRLRSDLQELSDAANALELERNCLKESKENQDEELRKAVSERERFERENDRLQEEAASLHSQVGQLQDLSQNRQVEIDQLRSEVEVLEGDNERTRSSLEIVEAEMDRLRQEIELLAQNNQIAIAEKESLEMEIQRFNNSNSSLTIERDRMQGEVQRLTVITTSAESEITRLRNEVQNLSTLDSRYQELEKKYTELQERITAAETLEIDLPSQVEAHNLHLEEVDWGTEAKIEDEHLQRSSSVEKEELKELKVKIIAMEKEKNEISDELQSAKLKNGKMIQKVKAANNKNENLLKEIEKLKKKAGGFSNLDMALEEEWKSQVHKTEKERDELKVKLDELEKEKYHMKDRLDVLEIAQEKYLELKEAQDVDLRQLTSKNKNLISQISSLEWKITELEEGLDHHQHCLTAKSSEQECEPAMVDQMIAEMTNKIQSLNKEIDNLKSEICELKNINDKLKPKLDELNDENESLQSVMDDLRDAKSKAETNANSYKTSFLELHTENETLQETHTKVNKELESVKYEQVTLKAAYDSLYEEYHHLQDNRDAVRLELGIMTGEKDKLQEEVNSLNNQLQALQEEEEEEIIKALQDECNDLRTQNNDLKDEITKTNESQRQMEESVERMSHSLDQQVEIQDLLRSELVSKRMQNDTQASTIAKHEQQIKYMKAEMAALKTTSSQQQQALEQLEPQLEDTKVILTQVQEKNKQLAKQVEVADASLVKLATRQTEEESGERFSTMEASELEAALSSLHLRDLRCQQLSLEINKLLEERDGLQLKLSAALRQNQDLTRELSFSQQPPPSPSSSLSQKLEELRDLNSSLERRAIDTLRSGPVAGGFSALPPSFPTFVSHTAPSTPTATRHRDYTVTRENHGTPSILMKWLLGKSTPKEVLHV